MKKTSRSEAEVFVDLAALTRAPGYVHAIAQICYRDNLVTYANEMKASDLERLFSRQRLIRTEITTILGLLVRVPIEFSQPAASVLQGYVDRTDRLMEELHEAVGFPIWEAMIDVGKAGQRDVDIWRGEALREPIFYGGESAYSFQYRELVSEKYSADNPWLVEIKGFSVIQAQTIARTMCALLDEKVTQAFNAMKKSGVSPLSWLSAFEQSPDEIALRSGLPIEQVRAFLDAFTLRGNNTQFQSLGDFNALNATPLLAAGGDRVLLFQHYSIYESLYESPFYWMMADKAYQATAAQHRGAFTEAFAARRLASVFGIERVHSNVHLAQSKGTTIGEIDVLVAFGDRLIIVQAKSKRLTLEARRGNDGQLLKDFAAAIQDSYDQARLCAQAILAGDCRLLDAKGAELLPPLSPTEILIFNVVADHYPALAFQTRQFLKYQTSDKVRAPFVMDVFLLDTLTEMLNTPLRLLSYAKLRVENIERLSMSHEHTALGFHLKRNLWIESEVDVIQLEDDIAVDLDLAMTVRRDNVSGARTPEGILTRLADTLFEHLLFQIEKQPDPATMELGFLLLTLGEDTCQTIHHGLEFITRRTRTDGRTHDFTIAGDYGGITFHCNPVPSKDAMTKLGAYCECRKYAQRAQRWFGVSLDAKANLQFGVVLESNWQQSDEMDLTTADMRQPMPAAKFAEQVRGSPRVKIGRNDPCPCGSGTKFKKCCLGKPATAWAP
ncbi:nuclease-related domain-containing protein [Paraburkholderia tuberum]|uniref:SEC-C motif-containing protein n=1 Tax=Paraburkholderia tuberum TaxID=157910 RepID=A0A1H1FRZ8_9BURK|nr:nuclease-related domain-containing protein [Paraburkholderia tuberum]SDR03853.1 SEC-C motif-containing protein [Paraburkholderia tuberum]